MSFFLIDREIFNHPIFSREPYSRRDAWLWLIGNACFSDGEHFINGKITTLKRGQLSYSIRFLSAKWQWDKAKVERFFGRLKTETMIETQNETGQLTITICNYNKYQTVENKNETQNETQNETGARQERDRSETKNNNDNKVNKENKRKKESSGEPLFYFPWLPDEQWNAFKEMRNSIKKPMTAYAEKLALEKLRKFHERGLDVAAILENSIINNYQGLFEPKGQKNEQSKWATEGQRLVAMYEERAQREREGTTG